MSLNPIGYVVHIHVTDDMCLYFTHLTRGGLELTADLDKAMLFDTVERARDFAFHASYILQVDEQKFTVEACFEMVTPDGELDLVEESHLLHPDETEETL